MEVTAALEALCEDPANLVFVISGRKKDDLQEWLGHIPNLGRCPSTLHPKHSKLKVVAMCGYVCGGVRLRPPPI